jgi:methyl-accepting chemotaxis protein
MKLPKMKYKLTGRIMVSVLGAVFAMTTVILIIIGIGSSNQAKKAGIELAVSNSREVASDVTIYLDQAIEGLNSLQNTAMALRTSSHVKRDDFNKIVHENLAKHSSYLAIWHMWEPNGYDNKDAEYARTDLYSGSNGQFNYSLYQNEGIIYNEPGTIEQYNEDYYSLPKQSGALTILEPYMYSYTGLAKDSVYETSIVLPILQNNKLLGSIGIDISLESLKDIIAKTKLYESGFSAIVSNELQIAAHPDAGLRGKSLMGILQSNMDNVAEAIKKGRSYNYIDKSTQTGQKVLRCFSPIKIGKSSTQWSVMVEIPMNEVSANASRLMWMIVWVGLFSMAIVTIIIYLIARSIVKPIRESAEFSKQLALGNLDAIVPSIKSEDEIAEMARSQQAMVDKLKEIVLGIRVGAENIFAASQHMNKTSLELSEGANEQAASTEEVSSNMEEMVGNINQNTENSQLTETIANKAASDIENGSKAVITTVEAMKQIADKISIIGVIAEKTDILAINAAIEAARAGEHGKGFAVVANEIRKLAERSQNAAKQIDELSKSSVSIADKSGEELLQIVPSIKKTAMLVQEITAASVEQIAGAEQINSALQQLNTITQRNAAASEEMAASSEELYAQAEQLRYNVAFFKTMSVETDVNANDLNKVVQKTRNTSLIESSINNRGIKDWQVEKQTEHYEDY